MPSVGDAHSRRESEQFHPTIRLEDCTLRTLHHNRSQPTESSEEMIHCSGSIFDASCLLDACSFAWIYLFFNMLWQAKVILSSPSTESFSGSRLFASVDLVGFVNYIIAPSFDAFSIASLVSALLWFVQWQKMRTVKKTQPNLCGSDACFVTDSLFPSPPSLTPPPSSCPLGVILVLAFCGHANKNNTVCLPFFAF